MKVLQINNFHYVRGGSDKVYLETINLLKDAGHEVYSFSSEDERNLYSRYSDYFVKKQNLKGELSLKNKLDSGISFIYNFEAIKKLKLLLKDYRPDIAHLHIFQSRLSSAIVKVFKDFDIPVVMTVHEYKMLCPAYTFLDKESEICETCARSRNYLHAIKKKCIDNSYLKSTLSASESFIRDSFFSYIEHIDHFIMVSKFIFDKHAQYEKKYLDKSSVLYNFIDFEKLSFFEKDIFKKGDYMLYLGRLSKEKGLNTLIQAFENLSSIKLKIVGDGNMKPQLEEYVKNKQIRNIDFLGFKHSEEVLDLISKASFIIVPSEWYENNPMTVIEAMAMGKPVIGADIGGIPELIRNGENGYLFESRNVKELAQLINHCNNLNDNSYNKLSENSMKFAKSNFSSTNYIRDLEKIYLNVIETKGRK
ncbi:MAG: glycosyltransferase family 4 protein [Bacteroidetes bacterium]|nr:glycosyltransferase family 4 protein [Bacteroidota bacterium]